MRVSEAEAAGRGLNSGDSVSPLPLSSLSPGRPPALRRSPSAGAGGGARRGFPSPARRAAARAHRPAAEGREGMGGEAGAGAPLPGGPALSFPGEPRRGTGAAPSAAGPVSPVPRDSGVGRGGCLPFGSGGMVPGRDAASLAGPVLSSPGRSSRRAETSTPAAPPGWGAAAAAPGPAVCSSEQRLCNFRGFHLVAGWVCGLPAVSGASCGSLTGVKAALSFLGCVAVPEGAGGREGEKHWFK